MSSIGCDAFPVEGAYAHFTPVAAKPQAAFAPASEFGDVGGWEDFSRKLALHAGPASPEFDGHAGHGAEAFAAAFGDQPSLVSRGEDGVHSYVGGDFDHAMSVHFGHA